MYFEEKDRLQENLKSLKELPGSKITFFKNGESLGDAFTDIYMVSNNNYHELSQQCTVNYMLLYGFICDKKEA